MVCNGPGGVRAAYSVPNCLSNLQFARNATRARERAIRSASGSSQMH